jgi:ABC-type multidrug transport system ATPase subunit
MWELVRPNVQTYQRSVIFTTHSIQEADHKCQQIGIMVNGRIVALGSSQHLKSRFSVGYQVGIGVSIKTEMQ